MPDSATVKIRCSACRRVFHVVTAENYLHLPRTSRPPWRRPSLGMMPVHDYATAATVGMEESPALYQLRYTCHRLCGKTYVVGRARYHKAVTAALANSRGEVLLGLDC